MKMNLFDELEETQRKLRVVWAQGGSHRSRYVKGNILRNRLNTIARKLIKELNN